MPSRAKRPRDPAQLAKLMVDIATGEVEDRAAPGPAKDPTAAAMGRKGGQARAKNLSKKQRVTIAKKAAKTRWRQDA